MTGSAAVFPYAECRLVRQREQAVAAHLSCLWTAPNVRARTWIIIGTTPPTLPGQTVLSAELTSESPPLAAKAETEHSYARRRVLTLEVPADERCLTSLRFHYKMNAHLSAFRLQPGSLDPRAESLPKDQVKRYTQPTDLMDFKDRAFQAWLQEMQLKRRPDETDLMFGWRAFSALSEKFRYHYQPDQDRRSSVLCTAPTSDCGGISLLFASTLRSNGIPARTLFGRWAQSDGGRAEWTTAHVKSEFYADKVGWIPVELSYMIGNPGSDPMSCFGAINADFLTFHEDTDLLLDSKLFGRQNASWLQTPAMWVSGSGSLDGHQRQISWTVRSG